jgi:N-acyl-D-amino-acid deacylase
MMITMRSAVPAVFLLLAMGSAITNACNAQARVLIRNATIVDGTGAPRRVGDVRLLGARIAGVGALRPTTGETVIDAHGLVLAPGFVDTHSHHDWGLFERRDALAMVSQGITTIVVGQDGAGMNLAALFARVDSQPPAVNVASYAGHGSIRRAVLGTDFKRVATPREVERMKTLLKVEMDAGALGLSTGLEYDPDIYSAPEEVLALAKTAADAGGRYISHIRSEDRGFWSAIDEIITIGRVNRMPVQVSHMKLGMIDLWGQTDSLIRVLDRARAAGIQITADIYPYTYWQSNLAVFYPKRNFADSVETAFILSHVSSPDGIIFNTFPRHPEYLRKTLAEVAELRSVTPTRAMLDLLAEPGGPNVGVVARGMADVDVSRLAAWPWANICSDGMSTGVHPRGFGSFARVAGRFVREQKLFSLEEAVRKMTSLAATNMGLRDRGLIQPGMPADLVLFDPAAIADRATFETPQATSVGVRTVWVNGEVVFDNGAPTGRYPGRAVKRGK